MQVRPTIMASALLQAAIRNSSNDTAKRVLRHAITDDPKNPLKTGYNRVVCNNIRVSPDTLTKLYKE